MWRRRPRFGALFAALASSSCYNSATDLEKLVSSNQPTESYVVHLNCGNHGAVYYGFRVDGREYRGKAPSGVFACSSTKLGDKRPVYYYPENPNIHSLFMPREAYDRALGWYVPEWWWFIGVPFVFVIFSVVLEVKRGKKQSAQSGS